MNKKLIYSLIAGTMFTLTSCDDFLDVQPASGFTPEYIFSSESEMKALMTRIYSSMTEDGLYGSNLASGLNTNTDVEMSSFKNNTVSTNGSDIGCFDSRPTWSVLNATWNNIYYAINYANDFLQAVQESPLFSDKVTGDTPSETQQMYGEVKTLRAMLYLDLIRTWGDVVFIIKPTEATDDFFSLGTTDRNVILEYLIDDLIAVEPMMKYAVDLDYGVERASREYCQSLIGQLALYRGGWTLRADKEDVTHVGYMERGDNFEHYYEIAITYLGKVIKESKHDLTQSFENLWVNECNWKTANNDDVMFAVPMLKSVTSRYGYNIGVTIAEGKHSYGSARNYVTFCGTYVYSFDKDDLRRDMTCVPYKYDKDLNQEIDMGVTGMGVGKWSKLYMQSPLGTSSGTNTGVNNVRMRFADVLLMYAEVENVLKDDGQARWALNKVRERVDLDPVESSGTELRDAIRQERRLELALENQRLFDIRRWKNDSGKSVMSDIMGPNGSFVIYNTKESTDTYELGNQKESSSKGRNFKEERDLVYPIPTTEISQSNGSIVQNPGYN